LRKNNLAGLVDYPVRPEFTICRKIDRQQAVVVADPSRSFPAHYANHIEERRRRTEWRNIDAVPVEIENDRQSVVPAPKGCLRYDIGGRVPEQGIERAPTSSRFRLLLPLSLVPLTDVKIQSVSASAWNCIVYVDQL
jgi:hypothetical protein